MTFLRVTTSSTIRQLLSTLVRVRESFNSSRAQTPWEFCQGALAVLPTLARRFLLACADLAALPQPRPLVKVTTTISYRVWVLPGMFLETARPRCAAVLASHMRARYTTRSPTRAG